MTCTIIAFLAITRQRIIILNSFFIRKHKGQSLVCDESVYSEDSGNVHLTLSVEILPKPSDHLF